MTGAELREQFLKFFEERGHARVSSSSLVPEGDPTLLFTNAGMVQFKSVFTGQEKRSYVRATTSQKCLRVSGKHNDLENVGYTPRHHTFFEMLGNFSFGDYFKEDAVAFAWEFLTKTVGLPKDRLHVTIYKDDDEAEEKWKRILGKNANPIVRLGEKDNFWSVGDTGPCGPCSEIHYDQSVEFGCGKPDCAPGCYCDRFLELWNLVFMQFDRASDGTMTPLPRPSIDTGLGLERLAAVVQGVGSNWESDLFAPIIGQVERLSGNRYGHVPDHDIAMRVIADHLRSATFLIADGIEPSNEDRGYVLRRILRRAIRYGMRVGMEEQAILYEVVPVVAEVMGEAYPEVIAAQTRAQLLIRREEELFLQTLGKGEVMALNEIERVASSGSKIVPGEIAFRLYDTYGFPIDITSDIARDRGLAVDEAGFNREMERQREMARQAREGMQGEDADALRRVLPSDARSQFTGYETLQDSGVIKTLVKDGQPVQEAKSGERVDVVTDRTPFYGEAGGQVGDQGIICSNGNEIEVLDCSRPFPSLIVHKAVVKSGQFRVGDRVDLKVYEARRRSIMANHSATHLLQWALRHVLGDHVKQSGSLVEPDRLRFDFTHFSQITPEELTRVEDLVNEKIQENLPVSATVMSIDEALAAGAMALFGEKYGQTVRLVAMGEISKELCGGTHTHRTGDIGLFKITSEGGIAAGVRRIEAVTASGAIAYVRSLEEEIRALAARLRGTRGELIHKLDKLIEEKKSKEKEAEALKARLAGGKAADLLEGLREVNGIRVLTRAVEHVSTPKDLRDYADHVRDKLGSGIALLGAKADGKSLLIAVVTKDLTDRFHAGNLVKKIAADVGGSGGGRADMAQAGGPVDVDLEKALKSLDKLLA